MAIADQDLLSIQQARSYAARAKQAQRALAAFDQEQVDRIVDAVAAAARAEAERLARLAHEETHFGNVPDKVRKNLFAAVDVHAYIRPIRTVGVLREDKRARVVEIAEPMGVVAAVIPSTNPTSTAINKAMIALKARDAVVMSPHPSAKGCIFAAWQAMHKAAVAAGMPEDAMLCLTEVTLEGTQELMRCRDTGVILATGGLGLVRAAYSSGRPAYGVGPGNVPVYIDRSADVAKAVKDVVDGKTFDFGTLCSSEQAIVCDEPVRDAVTSELRRNGAYFLSDAEVAAVSRVVVTPQRLANPEIVGRPATVIAERAGIKVPPETRVLVAPLAGVGRDFPLSIEKLSPVLAFYVARDWKEGSERCHQLLRYGGSGHTMGIHARDEELIRRFAMDKPVYRVVANTMTSMGATGYTTGLAPSMSLGCGAYAGNITSDNITPLHLMNVKRLAFGISREVRETLTGATATPSAPAPAPQTPAAPAADLKERVAAFVESKLSPSPQAPAPAVVPAPVVDFVSEDDVRRAVKEGRKIRITPNAIVTPSARDAAAGKDVLVVNRGA